MVPESRFSLRVRSGTKLPPVSKPQVSGIIITRVINLQPAGQIRPTACELKRTRARGNGQGLHERADEAPTPTFPVPLPSTGGVGRPWYPPLLRGRHTCRGQLRWRVGGQRMWGFLCRGQW